MTDFCKVTEDKYKSFKTINYITKKEYNFTNESEYNIFNDDNIKTIYEKIASYIEDTTFDFIYIWYKNKNNINKSLGFNYNFEILNPVDDNIDDRFLDTKNKIFLNYNNLLSDYDIKDNILYYVNLFEYEYEKNEYEKNDNVFNGIIKKYWPNIKDKKYKKSPKKIIDKNKRCLSILDLQIKTIDNIFKNEYKCDEFDLQFLKINNIKYNTLNEINIIKLFCDIELNNEYPFSKLFLNDYTDTYYKIFNNLIYDITYEKCLSFIYGKRIFVNEKPKYFLQQNTFTIIKKIISDTNTYYIPIIFYLDGNISIIIDIKDTVDNIELLNLIIKSCNEFIENINDKLLYSKDKLNLFNKFGENINIDTFNYTLKLNKYDIDFKFPKYKNLFENLISYTRVIKEYDYKKTDDLHCRYKRVADYQNIDTGKFLYIKYSNPPYNWSNIDIANEIKDELLLSEEEIKKRMEEYQYEDTKYINFQILNQGQKL